MIMVSISKPRIYEAVTVIFEIGLTFYALDKMNMAIKVENLGWFLVLSTFALILVCLMQIIFIVPAFWFIRAYQLQYVFTRVSQFMRYPANIFPRLIKIALYTIMPVMAASYLPVYVLIFEPNYKYIIYTVGITVAFAFAARAFWRLGERSYSSASS